MSSRPTRPAQPEPFLRGCAWPPGPGVPYPRCDPGPAGLQLPGDTRAMAAIPVGVRFCFVGEPSAVEVDYEAETFDLGYRGDGAGREFVAFRGDQLVDSAPARLGKGTVRLRIGEGNGVVTLHLPEGMRPTVFELRAEGGEIRPAPVQQRWLCYGDSIAEGWCASHPAWAWPHIVARRHEIDVVNLGYAGSARGEIQSALEIASRPADLITIAHGTNCWSQTPHSRELFEASLRAFLDLVRDGQPETPIAAISPILRMDAETTPNALGATLSDLRLGFEQVIEDQRSKGDSRLQLIRGRDLVSEANLPDGLHPDDAGHLRMAEALGPILAEAIHQQ